MFRLSMEVAPTPMITVREDGSMAMVNHAAEQLFGYDAAELIGQSVEFLLPDGLRSVHEQHRAAFVTDPGARPMGSQRDLYAIVSDGAAIPVEIGLSPVETSSGLMVICTIVDLSLRKKEEHDLLQLASQLGKKNERLLELVATDGLTSLKNRQAFMDHLKAQVEVSVRHGRPLSVLILDIDYFKAFNDEFGHLAGDEVLKEVGRILPEASRRSDLVARLGGEEFGIVLPETDKEGAVVLAERFREAIESGDWSVRPITVSIGATTVQPGDPVPRPKAPELSEILTDADRALYRSKDKGRNRVTHSQESS
ncbi:MAG: GGDEF domain-containing protein [Gemmatimonadetes bacterium]|nr:sensor domain-containing diguanylate cyclase [Gemmatimonadota bacterium]NNM06058.1 GGDEF domain-containing protein [Gemmatimonadota bacterium]